MLIERGDSIKFGEIWCKENGNHDWFGKTVKLTPQYYEEDNGLYTYYSECPGIYVEQDQESLSIFHLFGNNLERLMDCEVIKGTDSDKSAYEKIIKDRENEEAKAWEDFSLAAEAKKK